ncbi:fimbria/pilus outer membrane usher protein [Acinetobacter nematophilus]|uniref:Fimbria/pilus outer membrane usher protein n=1 Tax=Acinetobacter nematophilus TaxID=2994642 RepID=A0A9X3DV93_9GAMM|nr:fimbria/pilus outer membrane usher protein [Acinetobacter nematophilus]MCX5468620.1 fimbria/pilus outer membrane usher protein [Acinetobacter nematophilus]
MHCLSGLKSPLFLSKSLTLILISNLPLVSCHIYANNLPPPPRNISEVNSLFKLYLDLVVNEYSTLQTVPIIVKADHYYVQQAKIAELGIKIPESALKDQQGTILTDLDIFSLGFSGNASEWIALDQVSELNYHYNPVKQYLSLNIPASWMPVQIRGQDFWYLPETAQSGIGLLNNYDLYAYRPEQGGYSSTLFTEQRFFSPYGVLKNSGIYSKTDFKSVGKNAQQNNGGYRRYDTSWQYDEPQNALSYLIGDIFTGNKNAWGSSVRLGGLQVQRNFGTRPDLITYPLPQFKGEAALPSTVDLLINGQKINSTDVHSGPFILNNVPFVNGKGEAVVVTTDRVGRQVATTVPFYISNTLLKPGLLDYSLSVGQVREDYGIKDFSYGKFASSGDIRYGINEWFTAEGRIEFSNTIQLAGLGSVIKLNHFGVLSGSATQSWAEKDVNQISDQDIKGNQYILGYSYNQQRFGLSINYSQRDRNYYDLSRLQYTGLISANSNQNWVANTYFATDKTGTFGAAYIQTKTNDIENKLLNLSWAPILPSYMRGATVSLSANRDFVEKDWSMALQLSVPLFGKKATSSLGYTRQSSGYQGYINFNRATPLAGGFGVDLSRRINENSDDFNQARISYRNRYFNTDLGMSGDQDYSYWLGLSGSFVLMAGDVFASNRLGESFALIDTNKVADIPVHYENSLIGHSNSKGFIFVPSVTPYYAAKYSINPINLPSNFNATQVENRIAAKRGSGVVIKFPIKQSYAANVYLTESNGQPIPVGAVVHRAHHGSTYVGMDGIAYLEDLSAENSIRVQLPDQTLCEAKFSLDLEKAQQQIAVIKSVTCHEVVQP